MTRFDLKRNINGMNGRLLTRLAWFRPARWNGMLRTGVLYSFLAASLFAIAMLVAPLPSSAQVSVGVSVTIGPPPLPVYAQPLCPGPGFIWLPGYWAWDPVFGYYWVPGMWVPAPFIGALWTPGYWGWSSGAYYWHEGYWGTAVGFYGGINYGFGYTGYGYYGGYWSGGRYYYNRTVNNINVTNITTVYNKPVDHVRPEGPSFNGGRGGTIVRPTSEQLAAERQRRSSLTPDQVHQMRLARDDRQQRANVNHGRPFIAATVKPGAFGSHGFVSAERPGSAAIRHGRPNEAQGRGGPPRYGTEMHGPTNAPGHPQGAERMPPRQGDMRSAGPYTGKPEQHRPQPHPKPRPQQEGGMGERGGPR